MRRHQGLDTGIVMVLATTALSQHCQELSAATELLLGAWHLWGEMQDWNLHTVERLCKVSDSMVHRLLQAATQVMVCQLLSNPMWQNTMVLPQATQSVCI
jgi:hypothetical protein